MIRLIIFRLKELLHGKSGDRVHLPDLQITSLELPTLQIGVQHLIS